MLFSDRQGRIHGLMTAKERSTGTFSSKKQADKRWQDAESKLPQGWMAG
jgi:hypothetical protein